MLLVQIKVLMKVDKLEILMKTMDDSGIEEFEIEKSKADIEDCFINLMMN